MVYVGARDDFGWNQAHAVGVKALKELPGVKVVEEENVPETDAVSKTMESMINLDGAKLILPTSFGYYSPFVVDEAKANPDVQFRHAAPLWKPTDPKNAGSYFAFLDQAHYIDGVAAGLASKTGKLGFVAAKPIGIVLRNINSFLTGARTTNPGRDRPGDLHGRLVAAGARGGSHQRAGRRRLRPHHLPRGRAQGGDPDGRDPRRQNLRPQCRPGAAGAQGLRHRRRVQVGHDLHRIRRPDRARARPLPNITFGGYDKDMVQNSPYGAGATEPARKAADAAIADLKAGKPIFKTAVKDNKGKRRAARRALRQLRRAA